ncbi:MAG: winged helix DNA-binding domain-containing protein [Propionicimonas sp.]|nr:winged helix DNA-binding domain-containing protein [Propionicimonas sp.]
MELDQVLARRLATQRLTGPPADSPTQVVRELLCVQAQDAPLAKAMLAYRSTGGVAGVDAALAAGQLVRTHVLRPTWHYVAAEDLRWLLELTSARVESGMAARHRQLGVDEPTIARALEVITRRLAGRHFTTRTGLGEALADAGLLKTGDPLFGQRLAHLLLVAELRAVTCSAPADAVEHHYALIDEVLPVTPPRSRQHGLAELVGRFVASHGPVALSDLQRWTPLPLKELRTTLAGLADRLTSLDVDGAELWYCPDEPQRSRPRRAWLLSTFDEAYLSYRTTGYPRSPGHPDGDSFAAFVAAGGPVLCDLRDVGRFTRRMVRGRPEVTLVLDPGLSLAQRSAIDEAVDLLKATISG